MLGAIACCLVDGASSKDAKLHPIAVAGRVDAVKLAKDDIDCPGRQRVPVDGVCQLLDKCIKVGALR